MRRYLVAAALTLVCLSNQTKAQNLESMPDWALWKYLKNHPELQQQQENSSDQKPQKSNSSQGNDDRQPSILEAWYFVFSGHEVSDQHTEVYGAGANKPAMSRLVESSEDRIIIEAGNFYRETWTNDGCVITKHEEALLDPQKSGTAVFWLENILPDFEIRSEPYDRGYGNYATMYKVILNGAPREQGGDKAISCGYDSNGKVEDEYVNDNGRAVKVPSCHSDFVSTTYSAQDQIRVQRALNYIFTNFCTFAKNKKPF